MFNIRYEEDIVQCMVEQSRKDNIFKNLVQEYERDGEELASNMCSRLHFNLLHGTRQILGHLVSGRNVTVTSPRRSGKSEALCILTIHSIIYDNINVLVVSPSSGMSECVRERTIRMFDEVGIPANIGRHSVSYDNNRIIFSTSKDQRIAGDIGLVLLDEFDYFQDMQILEFLRGRMYDLVVKGVSTPGNNTTANLSIRTFFEMKLLDIPIFHHHHVNIFDSDLSNLIYNNTSSTGNNIRIGHTPYYTGTNIYQDGQDLIDRLRNIIHAPITMEETNDTTSPWS